MEPSSTRRRRRLRQADPDGVQSTTPSRSEACAAATPPSASGGQRLTLRAIKRHAEVGDGECPPDLRGIHSMARWTALAGPSYRLAAADVHRRAAIEQHARTGKVPSCGHSRGEPNVDGHGHILRSSGAKSLPIFLMSAILNGGPKVYSSSRAHDLTYLPTQELLQWRQRRSMVKTDGQTLYDYQLNECAEWPTSLARLAAATGLAGC